MRVARIEKPRKKPLQARAIATVEAITRATAHILVEHGYDALTTNHVAERAGVSIGSLYQYFPSKEALVGELLDDYCDKMNALFADVFMRSQALSPREVVRATIRAIYLAKHKEPELFQVLIQQLPRLGRLKRHEEDMAQVTAMVQSYLEAHASELRVHDVPRAAQYTVEIGEGLTTLASLREKNADPEAVIEGISEIIDRYLFS